MPIDPTVLNNLAAQYSTACAAYQAALSAEAAAGQTLGNARRAAAGVTVPSAGASTSDIVAIARAQADLTRATSAHDSAVSNTANALTAQNNAWAALLAAS